MPTKADKHGWKPKYTKEEPIIEEVPVYSEPEAVSFDYNSININTLANNLSTAITRPSPKTWVGRWFLSRGLELDQQRIDSVCSYIETIRRDDLG